jgi:ParB-like nuclease domain.
MVERNAVELAHAVSDFRRLRRRADLERMLAGLTGSSADLLSFEEVRRQLRATAANKRQLREIPPRRDYRQRRPLPGLQPQLSAPHRRRREPLGTGDGRQPEYGRRPPIDVYQIGDAYFVVDGNHRVSVARQNGAKTIQAYVTPFHTRVPPHPPRWARGIW